MAASLESYQRGKARLAESAGAANLKGNAPLGLSQEQNNANPIPRRATCGLRRPTIQRDDARISRIKLEASLKVLLDQHCPAAREPKLCRGNAAVPIAFDNNGTLDYGIAIFCERGIQQRHPLGGQFLSTCASLE
jgi:hypothetical protein